MKKLITILLMLTFCLVPLSALAASDEPVITMQPQSPYYPEYSVAIYTVKATGTNLTATWYIEYQGKTYNASKIGGAMQPWEAYAGEAYGAKKLDSNTFCFIFEGIEDELSGAEIWCEIEDGHYNVVSQVGHITVGNYGSPPEILSIPASITVKRGEEAEIRCVAKSSDSSQLNFLWYETGTGKFEDLQAINRGAETGDYMFCDTRNEGTRYYVCGITTSNGGMAYSSMVEVTVVDTDSPEMEILTKKLPDATVGQPYSTELKCNDPYGLFTLYHNPGKANQLEDSGLRLTKENFIVGTPAKAGTFVFSVCAAGDYGEDYREYTLTVKEAPETPLDTEPTVSATVDTEPIEDTQATPDSADSSENIPGNEDKNPPSKEKKSSWLVIVTAGVVAAAAGAGVALWLVKKKT